MMKTFQAIVLALTTLCMVCLPGGEGNAAESAFYSAAQYVEKPPYLVVTSPTATMSLLWQAATSVTQSVRWWSPDVLSTQTAFILPFSSYTELYRFDFPNLIEAQRYSYQVEIGSQRFAGNFQTRPSSASQALRFFVIGDTRSNTGTIDIICNKMLEKVLADKKWQTFVIHTGDWCAIGSVEEYWTADFFGPQWPHRSQLHSLLPFIGAKGNHDSGYLLKKYFPFPYVEDAQHYWSLDYGPVHVVFLDMYEATTSAWVDFASSEQRTWLEEDLKNSTKEWKVVVVHEPAFTIRADRITHPELQSVILPLCAQYGVSLILNGHDHMYARSKQMGIYNVTTAGGGAPLYQPDPQKILDYHIDKAIAVWHYCTVEINGKRLTFRTFNTSGEQIDLFVIDALPPVRPPYSSLRVY